MSPEDQHKVAENLTDDELLEYLCDLMGFETVATRTIMQLKWRERGREWMLERAHHLEKQQRSFPTAELRPHAAMPAPEQITTKQRLADAKELIGRQIVEVKDNGNLTLYFSDGTFAFLYTDWDQGLISLDHEIE